MREEREREEAAEKARIAEEQEEQKKAAARETADLKAWFKKEGKVGEWTLPPSELEALGVSDEHITPVLRLLREERRAVTKEKLIDLLLERAGKKAVGAPPTFDAKAHEDEPKPKVQAVICEKCMYEDGTHHDTCSSE